MVASRIFGHLLAIALGVAYAAPGNESDQKGLVFAMRRTGTIVSFELMMETAADISSGVDHGARGRVVLVWHENPPMRLEGVPVVDDEVDWATHETKSSDRFRGGPSG